MPRTVEFFLFLDANSKSEPAGRVPPRRHPFCPSGNKKDAKNASLLAEGIYVRRLSVASIAFYGRWPALWRAYRLCFSDPVETCYYVPSKCRVCGLKTPFATAEDKWIKADQQGKLFERSESLPCRLSSFRLRVPEGQGIGVPFFCLLFLGTQKE